jgi:hypothetical protein
MITNNTVQFQPNFIKEKMKNAIKLILATASVALLAACGGGGGGGDTNFNPNDITLNKLSTFPLGSYYSKDILDIDLDYSKTSITGVKTGRITNNTLTNALLSERVTKTSTKLPDTFFEGVSARASKVDTQRTNITANGIPYNNISTSSTSYYGTQENNFLGATSSTTYMVVTKVNAYPASVSTGDIGTRFEGIVYSDSKKTTRLGSVTGSWRVETIQPYNVLEQSNATIAFVTTSYDNAGAVISRTTARNTMTYLSDALQPKRTVKYLTTFSEDLSGVETGTYTTTWDAN